MVSVPLVKPLFGLSFLLMTTLTFHGHRLDFRAAQNMAMVQGLLLV